MFYVSFVWWHFFFVLCQLYGIVLLSTPSIWITAFDSVWCLWKAHKPYDAFLLCSDFMRFSHDRPIKWKYAITMSASTIFHSKYTALTYFSIYFSFYQSFLSLSLLHTQTQKRWEARIAFSIIMIVVENGNHCHKSSSSTYFSFLPPVQCDEYNKVNVMEILKQFQKWNPLWNHSSEFIFWHCHCTSTDVISSIRRWDTTVRSLISYKQAPKTPKHYSRGMAD